MPTAIAAVFATNPARVTLSVTGAPTITPPYQSNFAAGVDGWAAASGSPTLTAPSAGTPATLRIVSQPGLLATANRTVTGLTIGQTYKVSTMARAAAGKIALGVTGIGSTAYLTPTTRAAVTYSFVATATSHAIEARLYPPTAFPAQSSDVYLDTVKVERTSGWLGTSITRTDVNGTNVVVREGPGGQDTTGASGSGVMTVTDYESAVQGVVSYTVTDGNGVTASTTVTPPAAAGVWLTLPAQSNPATPTDPPFVSVAMVTEYDESGESNGTVHKIIGRADPIANPGPLAYRSGSMTLWCATYADARAVRSLLSAGAVAQLRQADYPGMDCYFVPTRVRAFPFEPTAPTQRWGVVVEYQEVVSP